MTKRQSGRGKPTRASEKSSGGPTEDAVLFCPFCRECFSGTSTCPTHELQLVPQDELTTGVAERPRDVLLARAAWLASGLLFLIAFVSPAIDVSNDLRSQSFTGLAAATGPAAVLWFFPLSGGFLVSLGLRGRTYPSLRRSRLAGLVIGFLPLLAWVYAISRVEAELRRAMVAIVTYSPLFWTLTLAGTLGATATFVWISWRMRPE